MLCHQAPQCNLLLAVKNFMYLVGVEPISWLSNDIAAGTGGMMWRACAGACCACAASTSGRAATAACAMPGPRPARPRALLQGAPEQQQKGALVSCDLAKRPSLI